MIFQHTLNSVLQKEKTQTARLWQDYYRIGDCDGPFTGAWQGLEWSSFSTVWSVKSGKPRKINYVGQELAVQPGRGQKGVATIRVLCLWKQDVRTYDAVDAFHEGFDSKFAFLNTWVWMHDMFAVAYQDNQTVGDWYDLLQQRPAAHYTARCIQFELVELLANGAIANRRRSR